ncbi:MAG: hypothetical protein ABIS27_00170 [Longimicrobiales bacterium]
MIRAHAVPMIFLCALATAACDSTPFETTDSARPQFAAMTNLTFNENFNLNGNPSGRLEQTGYGTVAYTNGVASFPSMGDRAYVRTIAGYADVDFKADITVTLTGGVGPIGIGFFGFGAGDTNGCAFYCEPAEGPTFYARIMPDDFWGPGMNVTTNTAGVVEGETAWNEGGDGTHRLRITWKAATRQLSFAIDTDYVEGTEFTPTTVYATTVDAGVFNASNSRIYFGGGGNTSFDNFHVTVTGRR